MASRYRHLPILMPAAAGHTTVGVRFAILANDPRGR
jgi:hypothetical protein